MKTFALPFLTHRDVSVYHLYQGSGSPFHYWFSWGKTRREHEEAADGELFDIRTMPGFDDSKTEDGADEFSDSVHESRTMWNLHRRAYQKAFLRTVIDRLIVTDSPPWKPFLGVAEEEVPSDLDDGTYDRERDGLAEAILTPKFVFDFLRALVPDDQVPSPESLRPQDYPPIGPLSVGPMPSYETEEDWAEYRARVEARRPDAELLRSLLRPSNRPEHDLWWLVHGCKYAMREIADDHPCLGRTPPTHFIAELRSTELRRALLRRQNRIDRCEVDRSTLWAEVDWRKRQPAIPFQAEYSVPGQNKRYHWEEVAAADTVIAFVEDLRKNVHPDTKRIRLNAETIPPEFCEPLPPRADDDPFLASFMRSKLKSSIVDELGEALLVAFPDIPIYPDDDFTWRSVSGKLGGSRDCRLHLIERSDSATDDPSALVKSVCTPSIPLSLENVAGPIATEAATAFVLDPAMQTEASGHVPDAGETSLLRKIEANWSACAKAYAEESAGRENPIRAIRAKNHMAPPPDALPPRPSLWARLRGWRLMPAQSHTPHP